MIVDADMPACKEEAMRHLQEQDRVMAEVKTQGRMSNEENFAMSFIRSTGFIANNAA